MNKIFANDIEVGSYMMFAIYSYIYTVYASRASLIMTIDHKINGLLTSNKIKACEYRY